MKGSDEERELMHYQGIVEACERVSAIASRAPAALAALEQIANALDPDDCAEPPTVARSVVDALERIATALERIADRQDPP
jgi:Ni,Fe-hydrogenase III large subunit